MGVDVFQSTTTAYCTSMRVIRHAGVDSRMIILDDQAQLFLHLPGLIISSVSEKFTEADFLFLLAEGSSSAIPSIDICRLWAVLKRVRSWGRDQGK